MPADEQASGSSCVCAHCDRDIEECSFCGRAECASPMCYGDVRQALGLQRAEPHPHGG